MCSVPSESRKTTFVIPMLSFGLTARHKAFTGNALLKTGATAL